MKRASRDVSEFARQVELHGDEFEIDNLVVKYDDELNTTQ